MSFPTCSVLDLKSKFQTAINVIALVGLAFVLSHWFSPAPQPVPDPNAVIYFTTPKVKAKAGEFVIVKVKSKGNDVKWEAHNKLTKLPEDLADKYTAVYIALEPGVYWVKSWTATKSWWPWGTPEPSDLAVCEVTIGDAPIPVPPVPVPPNPPVPNDPFLDVLNQAWQQEGDSAKAEQKKNLALFYRVMATKDYATMAAWFQGMGTGLNSAKLNTALPRIQRAIGDEFNKTLPRDPNAAYDKRIVGGQLERIATLVEALK